MFPGSDMNVASYFVPVKAEHGLWLDFNPAAQASDQHLAVVVDAQGVNAVTARPLEDKARPRLEKYSSKCPVHNQAFGQERHCASCGFKWPAQNYIPTNGTPDGAVWLDGFRLPTGEVRQFVFTEDEMQGVATHKLGAKRDFALRVTFYRSSERKPRRPVYRGGGFMFESCGAPATLGGGATRGGAMRSARSLDIKAGAKIRQCVYEDNCALASYEADPVGQILISYVPEEVAYQIIQSGVSRESTEGPLSGIPTGHDPKTPHQQY
jgi:hypothetical protein